MEAGDDLKHKVKQQARRMQQAERERSSLLAQSIYLGTLALLLVLPVVIGAYLGLWLDSLVENYSVRWTVSLIVLGVALGAFNVYLFVREHS
jgi:ATP synthase protein I